MDNPDSYKKAGHTQSHDDYANSSGENWIPVKKNKGRHNKNVNSHNNNSVNVSPNSTDNEKINGKDIQLSTKYVFWSHELSNTDWSLESYARICSINNVSEFWKLYNNLAKLGHLKQNFFLMKDGVNPIWEDPENRNGGFCTFKVNIHKCLSVFEDLSVRLLCNHILSDGVDHSDINGISFSPKNNWAIVKIWNKTHTFDIINKLDQSMVDKYAHCSIKYIKNEPEY